LEWDDDEIVTQKVDLRRVVREVDEATRIADPVAIRRAAHAQLGADDVLKARLLSGTGARVGRFLVQRHLDEGGMGLIFRALDEELGRPVALKILRAQQTEGSVGRARLIREAQALAKLSHPNVVTVYEVGEWEGHVFVAMELIEGRTLRGWLKLKRWGWREVIGVFSQAARGLAAAHKAGIVHRDFKLSNALVGLDGRVRVLDFGLALASESLATDQDLLAGLRPSGSPSSPSASGSPSLSNLSSPSGSSGSSGSSSSTDSTASIGGGGSSSLLGTSLTIAGTISGTPAYMAPEQLGGGEIDARADQYAFCIALYEGLYRRRPFRGKTIDDRRRELAKGVEPSFPSNVRVPGWLRKILRRGLAVDPDERYPTMDALIADLEKDPTRRRRWVLGGSVAAVLLLGGGYLIARQEAALTDPCGELSAEIGEVWNDEHRQALGDAIAATGLGYAGATWERLEPRLDAYAADWSRGRIEACQSHQSGAHDADLYGLEVRCLARRRSAFRVLIGTLEEADADVLGRAIQAAEGLPTIATCGDVGVLTSEVEPPEDPEVAAEVERLSEVLAQARVEMELRRHAKGLSLSSEVVDRSAELGYRPLEAQALLVHGNLLDIAGEFEPAQEVLRRGVWRADLIRDDELLAQAMSSLIFIISDGLGEYDEAEAWRTHADTVIERLGEGTRGEARLLATFGQLAMRKSRGDEAVELCSRALEIVERLYGGDDRRSTGAIMALGNAYIAKRNFAEAQALYGRALRINEEQLGPDHPALAGILNNLGSARGMSGDMEGALPIFERALRIKEAVVGPEHASLADALGNIGATYSHQEEHEKALPYMERALLIEERSRGPEHPRVAELLHNLGSTHAHLDQDEEGRALMERSLEIREAKLGKSAPRTISVMSDLGELSYRMGRERSGLRLLERALTRSKGHPECLTERAQTGLRLATIYRESTRRKIRKRAHKVAIAALADYTELGAENHQETITTLEAWIAELGPTKRSKKSKRAKKGKRSKKSK